MDIQKKNEIYLHRKLSKQYQIRYGEDYSIFYHDFWNSCLLEGLPVEKELYVLDCGCGSGAFLPALTRKFKKVVGLDLSIDLAVMADSESENFKGLVVGDAEKLPFFKTSFDIVFCRGSLHHLPNPITAIQEIYDKLKPGGFFVLSEPCDDSLLLRLPRKIFREKSGRFTLGHKAFRSNEITEMLCNCGFKIKSMRNFGLLAFPLCGLSDILPLMRFLLFRKALTKTLILFDEIAARTPLLKKQCWHIMIKAQK